MAHKYPAVAGNYTKGRTAKISEVVIHHMAGVMTAEQCGRIFQTSGRKASAHYGVGNDGSVGQYVNESDTAWATGNGAGNSRSINIETSNSATGGDWPVSDKTFSKLVELVADIAKRNNLGALVVGQNLKKHSDYVATACPGGYLTARMQRIADEANAINSATPSPKPTGFLPARGHIQRGDVGENVKALNAFMRKTFPAYSPAKIIGTLYGPISEASITEFQRRVPACGAPDGKVGPKTYQALKTYGFKG